MTNGNYVNSLPVPPKLVLPRKGDTETLFTRYTAVTCDPDEFEQKGFFLRQNAMGRKTELFIVITMYNVKSFAYISSYSRNTDFPSRRTKYYSAERCTV